MKKTIRLFIGLSARLFLIRAAWRGQTPVRVAVLGLPQARKDVAIHIVSGQRDPLADRPVATGRAA